MQISINNISFNTADVYKGIGDLFKNLDERINTLFPEKVEYSKIKEYRGEFKSSKIFSSLIKVDIPFENAFQIVCIVVQSIEVEKTNGKYANGLTTHDIRKVVQNVLLNYNVNEVSKEEVEKWADKYVRKYGHDGQRVEVYQKNLNTFVEVDFSFVEKTLLADILEELDIRNNAYRQEISKNQIKSISEEIIEFINDCNVYKIDYDILKQFVIQMALQPPHPWFVTDETFKNICQYDLEILDRHYNKLCDALEKKSYEDVYYTIYEAIHHSCSSILARYHEVLGSKDLDAFYNLDRIARKLYSEEENLLIEDYPIGCMPSDLRYASVTFQDFIKLIKNLKKKLKIGKGVAVLESNTVADVIKLCDVAVALNNNVDKNDVETFLYSNWEDFSDVKKKRYTKKIFDVINGVEVADFISEYTCCFWIKRNKLATGKAILAICAEKNMECQQIKDYINNKKAKLHTEAIFFIVEKNEKQVYDQILKMLEDDKYFIEIVTKKDLQILFESNNKYGDLESILNRGILS